MKNNNKTIYLCDNCGNEFSSWSGRCTMCGEWNTLKELRIGNAKIKSGGGSDSAIIVENLNNIQTKNSSRISTNIGELDRVLGGGIVPGSIILLGGEPGIGKSTLLLQLANNLKKVFYLSAEESAPQIKIRADRLKTTNEEILLASGYDIDSILVEAEKNSSDVLIVDSIQTVSTAASDSSPGSIVQVRECGMLLQQFAKRTGICVIIVGHVTKDGSLAGPRVLEHLVDVVLYLEGERFHDARILRGVKNRFGATNEAGIFSICEKGMVEVKNPSELFLSERQDEPGCVVAATLEGTRPILVEVQALVVPTKFGFPKRTSSGFDLNRLNLLAAVISKKTSVNLLNSDIYVNIVGGMKIKDPAIDSAVCLAVISSYKNKKLPTKLCLFGEIGLSGEIRNVVRQKDREKEATTLGYKVVDSDIKTLGQLISELKI